MPTVKTTASLTATKPLHLMLLKQTDSLYPQGSYDLVTLDLVPRRLERGNYEIVEHIQAKDWADAQRYLDQRVIELRGAAKPETKQGLRDLIDRQHLALAEASEALADLRSYLLSPKFHEDPTVQVRDVLHRMPTICPDTRGR